MLTFTTSCRCTSLFPLPKQMWYMLSFRDIWTQHEYKKVNENIQMLNRCNEMRTELCTQIEAKVSWQYYNSWVSGNFWNQPAWAMSHKIIVYHHRKCQNNQRANTFSECLWPIKQKDTITSHITVLLCMTICHSMLNVTDFALSW